MAAAETQPRWPMPSLVMVIAAAVINIILFVRGAIMMATESTLHDAVEWTAIGFYTGMAAAPCVALLGIRRQWNDTLCSTLVILSTLWALLASTAVIVDFRRFAV